MAALSRRALVGALPAAALVCAAGPVSAAPEPDATLLALGARFDAVRLVYDMAVAEQHRLYNLWECDLKRKGLFGSRDQEARNAVADDIGYTADFCEHRSNLCGRLLRLSGRIKRHQPQTVAGLAVWARAALFEAGDFKPRHEALEDADDSAIQIHKLVAVIERMAEVSHV